METRIAMVVTAILIVGSILAYTFLRPTSPATGPVESKIASVESLLGGLEARLAQNPGDAKGWLLLARSYEHLGDHSRAANAYQKAVALGMRDADLEMRLAQNSFAGS